MRSNSETQTERIGEVLGRDIDRGLCICLAGSLGSGKSVMARGICRGLGVEETVISPSFILYEEYSARLPVVHNDLYRLEHENEIEALGVFDRLGKDTVILVEWGDRSPRLMAMAEIVIRMTIVGESQRKIDFDYDLGVATVVAELAS
ncbi:MAG: tRNA (adenosine(37)-N6)-threonylcarbamoyltransferase complex ATPase subunit type 1 TsaE [Candidatus Krumholzibacteria bacterium]|nr:tRNA (adenosine(37)-N6)-threonylcarbamoyltransferase complex ATPase subunit type 1 TsaE [Candidatus Krumholzibacteria bacterium]